MGDPLVWREQQLPEKIQSRICAHPPMTRPLWRPTRDPPAQMSQTGMVGDPHLIYTYIYICVTQYVNCV